MKRFLILLAAVMPSFCYAQWSTDPSQNLQLLQGSIEPKMVSDGDGGAIVVGTSFTYRPRLYAQRVDRFGKILWDRSLRGIEVSTAGDQHVLRGSLLRGPFVVPDDSGGIYVAFNAWWVVGYIPEIHEEIYSVKVYLQRFDPNGNRLFGATGIPLYDPHPDSTGYQYVYSMITDDHGGVYVIFTDYIQGQEGKEYYVNHVNALGKRLWGDGMKLPLGWGHAADNNPIAYPDGQGGLCFYLQRGETIPPKSDRFWRINDRQEFLIDKEIEIGVPPWGFSPFFDFTSVGGNAIFVWRDFRGDTIRVQKLDREGKKQWGDMPIFIGRSWSESYIYFFMSPDSVGGCYLNYPSSTRPKLLHIQTDGNVSWEKQIGTIKIAADTSSNLFYLTTDFPLPETRVHKLNLMGVPFWDTTGVVLSTRKWDAFIQMISDGNEGIIVCWDETIPQRGIWAQQVNKNGQLGIVTSVKSPLRTSERQFVLHQNYPNPFNAETQIVYSIPMNGQVNLSIFNLLGEQVRSMVNAPQVAGEYRLVWDGKNEKGGELPSGVYLCRLKFGQQVQTNKLILIR